MGSAPKLKIFDTISATLNKEVVTIFGKQESFIKSELQKVETGLQMTEVDGESVYYLHSASINLLTKAEQILTYYLNEKGYEVSSSLENTEEEDETLLKRLQVTDDVPQQVVEKLLRRSKTLIKSYRNRHLRGSIYTRSAAHDRSKPNDERAQSKKDGCATVDNGAEKDCASKSKKFSKAHPAARTIITAETKGETEQESEETEKTDDANHLSSTHGTVENNTAKEDDASNKELPRVNCDKRIKNLKPLRTYQKTRKSNPAISKTKSVPRPTARSAGEKIDKEDRLQLPQRNVHITASLKLTDQNKSSMKGITEQIRKSAINISSQTSTIMQPNINNSIITQPNTATITPTNTPTTGQTNTEEIAIPQTTIQTLPHTATTTQPDTSKTTTTHHTITATIYQPITPTTNLAKAVINSSLHISADENSRGVKKKTRQKGNKSRQKLQFSCTVCTFETTRKSHFSRHIAFHQAHPDMEIHKCDDCSYSTTRISCLKHHIAVKHAPVDANLLHCDQCPYQTIGEKLLQKHKRIVHAPGKTRKKQQGEKPEDSSAAKGPFNCPKCDYDTKSYYFYVRHLRQHSSQVKEKRVSKSELVDPTSIGPLVGEFQCTKCPYKTTIKNLFIRHREKTHGDVRPHICDVCGRGFKRTDSLKAHSAIHLNDEAKQSQFKHKCPTCSKTFRSPAHLMAHLTKHTADKPYKCSACESLFKSQHTLKKHFRLIHGEAPRYPCPSCQMVFKTKSNLKRHKNTHEKGRKVARKSTEGAERMDFDEDEEESGNQQLMTIIETNIGIETAPNQEIADQLAAEYLVSLANCQSGDFNQGQESLIQSGDVIGQTHGQDDIIQSDDGFSRTHAQQGSLIEISQFTGEHQGTAFYITTDDNSALPAEILVQAPDGLPVDLITNSAAILHANQLPPTYVYLAD